MNPDRFRLRGTRPRVILLTDRAAAAKLRVSTGMVRLWVATGAWPLPRGVRGTSWLFDRSDVECWVRTGAWPAGARYRTGVRRIDKRRPPDPYTVTLGPRDLPCAGSRGAAIPVSDGAALRSSTAQTSMTALTTMSAGWCLRRKPSFWQTCCIS